MYHHRHYMGHVERIEFPGYDALVSRAIDLGRDPRAIARDADLLERFGLLRSRYEKNPGHGRRRVIESRANTYHLVATI